MKSVNRWQKVKSARHRWSFNACKKRERLRIERASAPIEIETCKPIKLPRIPFDLKVNLERRDGGRIQFRLHHFYGKLVGQKVNMSPKQFGRKLGEIFELWMKD